MGTKGASRMNNSDKILDLAKRVVDYHASGDADVLLTADRLHALAQAVISLHGEADLYRRAYEAIGACDISNFLALCAIAGRIGEPVLHDTAVRMDAEREYREANK